MQSYIYIFPFLFFQAPGDTSWKNQIHPSLLANEDCLRSWLSTESYESFCLGLFFIRFSWNTISMGSETLSREHVMTQLLRNSNNLSTRKRSYFAFDYCLCFSFLFVTIKSVLNWRFRIVACLFRFQRCKLDVDNISQIDASSENYRIIFAVQPLCKMRVHHAKFR